MQGIGKPIRLSEHARQQLRFRGATEEKKGHILNLKYSAAYLTRAFGGELTLQEPKDEPAPVLLERIRAEREKTEQAKVKGPDKSRVKERRQVEAETHKEYRITQIPRMGVNCGI